MTGTDRRSDTDRRTRERRNGAAAATPELFPRLAGVLLPLASLPSRHGIGDLGDGAHALVEWCGAAGLGWWQMLPVGPIGPGNSPYSSSSAFAGEPLYLSLDRLAEEGLLATPDLAAPSSLARGGVRYADARAFKAPRLAASFERWSRRATDRAAFERFCADEARWLEPWVRFTGGDAEYARYLQYQFDRQWRALRDAARAARVRLMGDAPIFVGAESADVAAHPELFRLDELGRPIVSTGCPPDACNAAGQSWGHPHYAWDVHRADDFDWWRRRFRRLLDCFDAVRIDHFIGFHRAWEVPGGRADAREGAWSRAPGSELLASLSRELGGRLPFVAEDLGAAGGDVFALRDAFALPGMRILQWGFAEGSDHAPHRCPENAVVYPGTHDNDTVAGWWKSVDRATRRRFRAHGGGSSSSVHWDMARAALTSAAHTAIVQWQDWLGLGRSARTNVPGTPDGNWTWRASRRDFTGALAARIRDLVEAADRLPR